MIIFLLFICFWIGISFRYQIIIFSIVSVFLIFLIFYRFKKRIGLLAIGLTIIGVGISYIKIDIKKESYSGIVIDSHPNYFLMLSGGEKLYSYNKNNEYEIGDYLKITGQKEDLSFTRLESQFDFKDYLNKKGVYYSLKAEKIEVKFSNPIRIRNRREKFLSHFDEKSRNLIGALLFSENVDDEILNDAKELHIGRLINASGIFIYAYLHFFAFILAYFIKDKKWKFLPIVVLLPYLIFTFPRFTIIRIIVLEIFRYINEVVLKKKFTNLTLVGIVGTLFLLFDFHLGYQMSFIIGFTMPFFIKCIREAETYIPRRWKKPYELLLIYIFFIPFELKFYNGTNPLSLITNFALSPLFIFEAVISLLCFYGVPIYAVVNFSTKCIGNLIGWLAKISFQVNAPPFEGWMVLIFGFIFLVYCYYRSIGFIPIYRAIAAFFLVTLVLYHVPVINFISEEVCFINVGQGDSCLVRRGTTSVLIDTGGLTYTDLAKETLIPFLKKKRIYNLDLVITTHNDFDHSGALDSLKENFYVKRIRTNTDNFPISVGGLSFTNYNNNIAKYSGENDQSLVIGFALMHKYFLVMGDAPIMVERNMINEYPDLDCDILKVGHHGSNTSSCKEFIKHVTPDTAIISAGKNNKYGHPHKSVLKILEEEGVTIRRTDIEGTITYFNYIFM